MIIFARAPGTTGWVEIKPEEELSHRGQFWEIRKFAVESDGIMPLARRLDRAEQALRAAGFYFHGKADRWIATQVSTAVVPAQLADPRENTVRPFSFNWDGATDADFASLLPGTYYMDEPDGGSVTVLEQFRRMAADAAKWRAMTEDGEISRHAFEDWWENFKSEHDEWEYADSSALRWAAWQAARAGAA